MSGSESYKLIYFNIRGRAETIRYILALGEAPYEDFRVQNEEWPKLKPSKELINIHNLQYFLFVLFP